MFPIETETPLTPTMFNDLSQPLRETAVDSGRATTTTALFRVPCRRFSDRQRQTRSGVDAGCPLARVGTRGAARPQIEFALQMRPGSGRGFTLVEMLVVMTVILILLALVVPATVSLLRGSQVGQGGDVVMSQLELARQTALARNRSVQVRLCRPTNGHFTAIMPLFAVPATNVDGSVKMNTDGTVTMSYNLIGKPVSLPNAVIMDAGANLSTILNPVGVTPATATTADPSWGNQGTNYQYVAFQFQPDGSTDLAITPNSPWFLTVHSATDGDSLPTPPANYCTIQIDPYNGHIQEFRP